MYKYMLLIAWKNGQLHILNFSISVFVLSKLEL